VFFLLSGRWLELRLRNRTAGALEAVMNRLPDSVRRQTANGDWERISIRRLAVGDVLEILPGEAIAADGQVLQGQSQVDEALLTGESRPLSRGVGSAVIAGSHNLSAVIHIRVTQVGAATRFAQIVSLMESASVSKPDIALVADRWAKPFLLGVLLASAGAAVYWWLTSPAHALMVAVAVLVVTCPCALSLATPAAMLATAGALARSGVLVRRLQGLQALASVDTVVFDKTGTLTRDAFALASVHTRAGVSRFQALSWAGALARHSLHPVSRALWSAARHEAGQLDALPALEALQVIDLQERPGQGVLAHWPHNPAFTDVPKGWVRLGSAEFCNVAPDAEQVLQAVLADEDGWLATFRFQEDIRDDALATVQALQGLGLKVMLLSGDRDSAVQKVAKTLGISDARGAAAPGQIGSHANAASAGPSSRHGGRWVERWPGLGGCPCVVCPGPGRALGPVQGRLCALGRSVGGLGAGLGAQSPDAAGGSSEFGMGCAVQRGLRAPGLDGLVTCLAGGLGHGLQFAVGGAQCLALIAQFRTLNGVPWIFCIC